MANSGSSAARPPVHLRVLQMLSAGSRPMTAYQLLDELRAEGRMAPPTVYRALHRLIAEGRAHRIASLNAFVACAHPAHAGSPALAICEGCGRVLEFVGDDVVRRLDVWASDQSFRIDSATIEVKGRCAGCTSDASGAERTE